MLAEIFMVRLEAAVRPVQEKLPSSVSPFVPFSPSARLSFKRNEDGTPEGEREKFELTFLLKTVREASPR